MPSTENHSPWPTIVGLGVMCGVTLGLLLFLIYRKKSEATQALDFDFGPAIEPVSLPEAKPKLARQGPLAKARTVPVARTTTVSATSPTMLLQAAGGKDWTVWVRNVGPPGSFASFIIGGDSNNSALVPAGGHQQMRLPRGEYLFAQGDVANVIVSVSGGEDQ